MTLLAPITGVGGLFRRSTTEANRHSVGQRYQTRAAAYDVLDQYAANERYARADAEVDAVKGWYGLPRDLRPISPVAARVVNWWVDTLYDGQWTVDGLPDRSGQPNKLAYDERTPEPVRLAVQQAFTWANAEEWLDLYVETAAALGNAFAEVEVSAARRKVYPRLIDPRHVVELELNATGDVARYRLAVPTWDADGGRTYLWGKAVDKETIRTYYDDEPRGYDGAPAAQPNPWGFVPAVWVAHRASRHGVYGRPAIEGIVPTIDEYNGLLAAIDDYILRFVHQLRLVGSDRPEGLHKLLADLGKAGASSGRADPRAGREAIPLLPGPAGLSVHPLIDNLGLGEADPHVERLRREIEQTVPESAANERMAEVATMTGPAARAFLHPVQKRLNAASASYNRGIVRLGQMCLTIGGELMNGPWGRQGPLSANQRKFLPFRLTSFDAGETAFSLLTPQLLPQTLAEKIAEAEAIERLRTPSGMRHAGLSDEAIFGPSPAGPDERPRAGLLAELEQAAARSGDAFGRLFDAGLGAG